MGASFGVPSDLDNGAFEFIAEKAVVADAVTVNRLDLAGITEDISFNLGGSGIDIEVGNFSIVGPLVVGLLNNIYYRKHSPFSGFTVQNEPVNLTAMPIENRYYGGKNVSSVFRVLQKCDKAALDANLYANIQSNPLSIISANAVSPYNYNRYRHANVSARIDYTRDCYTAFDYVIGNPSNPLIDAANSFYPPEGIKSTAFYVKCSNRLYYWATVFPENTKCTVYLKRYTWNDAGTSYTFTESSFVIPATRPDASSVNFYLNNADVEIQLELNQTVTNGGVPGINEQNCSTVIKSGSFIFIKSIAFNAREPVGLDLLVSQMRGLDVGVTFSSAMDNNV